MGLEMVTSRRRYAAGWGRGPGSPKRLSERSPAELAGCHWLVAARVASHWSLVGMRVMEPLENFIFTKAASAACVVFAPAFGPQSGASGAVTFTSIVLSPTASWSTMSRRSKASHWFFLSLLPTSLPLTLAVKLPRTATNKTASRGLSETGTRTRNITEVFGGTANASWPGSQIQRMAWRSAVSSTLFQRIHLALQSEGCRSPISHHAGSEDSESVADESQVRTFQ